ncbi:hypothetical protein CCR79_12725 [Halorhodospira halophila]|nr:hypothetical protein [Halorhodospira halophila]
MEICLDTLKLVSEVFRVFGCALDLKEEPACVLGMPVAYKPTGIVEAARCTGCEIFPPEMDMGS